MSLSMLLCQYLSFLLATEAFSLNVRGSEFESSFAGGRKNAGCEERAGKQGRQSVNECQ